MTVRLQTETVAPMIEIGKLNEKLDKFARERESRPEIEREISSNDSRLEGVILLKRLTNFLALFTIRTIVLIVIQ